MYIIPNHFMNAYFLHKPDGTETQWSACGKCEQVAAPGNYDVSVKCCACYACGLPLSEAELATRSLYHSSCQAKIHTDAVCAGLEIADLVEDYTGPVYCDGAKGGSFGSGYFSDVEELARSMASGNIALAEFAHCCESMPACELDLDSILESATQESFEDARDSLNGEIELRRAIEAFNAENSSVLTWNVDYTKKVRIPKLQAA